MSSRRSYSKESRSYYSRSSSCEDNSRTRSSSYRHRPLSSFLTERDFPSPPLAIDRFDDPFFFDRPPRRFLDDFDRQLRWRFHDEEFDDGFLLNKSSNFGRNIPINTQEYSSSTSVTRNVPVQYSTSSNQRENFYKKTENHDSWSSNEGFQRRENRITTNDWPRPQEPPTRKRTSMTIYLRQPRIQYSDAPNQQRTTTTSYTTNYY